MTTITTTPVTAKARPATITKNNNINNLVLQKTKYID